MKLCAIICEYNPLHTGHAYQIDLAKKNYDAVACIMSGDFTQRARPAVVDKAVRSAAAIDAGADLVVELPLPYASADAGRFARGGVLVAAMLPQASALMMGSEVPDTELLFQIAHIQIDEDDCFKSVLGAALSSGAPYAAAYATATEAAAVRRGIRANTVSRILRQPNALLCVEYIKEIQRQNVPLTPHLIRRIGAGHDQPTVQNGYASASAVREMLYAGNFEKASEFLHNSSQFFAQTNGRFSDQHAFDTIAHFSLRTRPLSELETLYSAGEGIAARVQRAALHTNCLAQALQTAKTKRYTLARLNRLALESVLDIKKSDVTALPPVRVLAVRSDFRRYLSQLKAPFVIRNTDYAPFLSDPAAAPLVHLHQKASRLFGQLAGLSFDPFYERKLLVID